MIVFAMLTLVVSAKLCDAHEYSPEGWGDAAKYLKEAMDENFDPCEDFYNFACGNWNKSRGHGFLSEIDIMNKDISETILNAINGVDLNDFKTENFKRSLKTFYQQCNARPFDDIELFVKDIYESLQKYFLPNIDEQKNGTESYPWDAEGGAQFWKFLGRLQHELGVSFLMQADVQLDEVDCENKPVLHIRPSPFQMTSVSQDFSNMLLKRIVSKFHNITLSEKDIKDTTVALYKFEFDIYNLLDSIGSKSECSPSMPMLKKKYEDLQMEVPYINWSAYFEGLLPENMKRKWLRSNPTIVLQCYDYFQNLLTVLDRHDKITTSNYGFLLVLSKYYQFFGKGTMKSNDRMNTVQKYTIFSNDTCLDLSVRYFNAATFRLFCEHYKINVIDWKNDIWYLKEMVFSAFKILLQSIDWMDVEDKMKLFKRVDKITFYGYIPDWIVSNDVIDSKTPQYFSNLSLIANDILAQKKLFSQQMKALVTGLLDDLPPNFFQNAYYSPTSLAVSFLIGLQVPPLYKYTYPLSLKFGIAGLTLAHELMHGFGTLMVPQIYDYTQITPKLKNSTIEALWKKFNCSIPFYNSYCVNTSTADCTFGINTIEENTADMEGLKIAYTAYKFATQSMGDEPPLNGLVEYSSEQIFFISVARECCSNEDTSDPYMWYTHSPKKARAEQSLMNFPPFAKAFNCSLKSRYVRNQTCSTYGNLWNILKK